MTRLFLVLSPASKDYLWGGSRLNDDYALKTEGDLGKTEM